MKSVQKALVRGMTHLNLGATLALLAWLASRASAGVLP